MDRLSLSLSVGTCFQDDRRHEVVVFIVERQRGLHLQEMVQRGERRFVELGQPLVRRRQVDDVRVEVGKNAVVLLPVVVHLVDESLIFGVPVRDDHLLLGKMRALRRRHRLGFRFAGHIESCARDQQHRAKDREDAALREKAPDEKQEQDDGRYARRFKPHHKEPFLSYES